MTSRRVPLANLPNATNSPYRDAAAPGTKRARSHAGDQRELAYAQPPAKKLMLEADHEETRRHALPRKTSQNPPTALQRKLEAARDSRTTETRPMSRATEKAQKASQDNLESIRQWQRHYKKIFPQIVFYYESIPEDMRSRISRRVQTLGAHEEVFFSKTVTHVVTTRPIPPELTSSSSNAPSPPKDIRHGGTINPLELALQHPRAGRFSYDTQKKSQSLQPNDILFKARELGIKIWSLEKLERMLTTMFNTETGEAPSQSHTSKAGKADLSQLLQKEKMLNQAGYDWAPDMAHFRGYFVYIHDADEQTRPVMLRDYPKPASREQMGKWPQLRVNAAGRCPFLDDSSAKPPAARPEPAPRTRAAAAREAPAPTRALAESAANLTRRARTASLQPEAQHVKPLDPPKSIPLKRGSTDNLPLYGSAQASLRRHPRFAGGEPVASGLQASNVTSAIRSQMISSTAAVPGTKVGPSKELHRLGRRVLERTTIPVADKPMPAYSDMRAAINKDPVSVPVATKRKVDDALEYIQEEEFDVSEDEEHVQRAVAPRKKKVAVKDLKPGYCENCRAKFDDFDEHVVSKSHRKFATTDENWKELDQLLDQLVRPRKDVIDSDDDGDELAF
ncbi:hypothetical protein EG328_003823 [Venturia inaequalis]|uniref:DBF4-type domain-containing protein n=1 Tax=Venturia inaequalis TaxID=5025 RepID=A0A8H3Z2N6_VENIN|nr:hypothetical protein EG328_003823 [Venturia inaequalis]KAE9980978.1 hypothetical protein EG327_006384 [Venturia inaequalis]